MDKSVGGLTPLNISIAPSQNKNLKTKIKTIGRIIALLLLDYSNPLQIQPNVRL